MCVLCVTAVGEGGRGVLPGLPLGWWPAAEATVPRNEGHQVGPTLTTSTLLCPPSPHPSSLPHSVRCIFHWPFHPVLLLHTADIIFCLSLKLQGMEYSDIDKLQEFVVSQLLSLHSRLSYQVEKESIAPNVAEIFGVQTDMTAVPVVTFVSIPHLKPRCSFTGGWEESLCMFSTTHIH